MDGSKVPFNPKLLQSSLRRAGAPDDVIESITTQIQKEITDGLTTTAIYRRAFSLLKETGQPLAARYSMKRAVLALGPSGFPFENFVAEIFKTKGYSTNVGKIVKGLCVEHEVDVILSNKEKCIGAELKFHNKQGIKSDLKDALYVHARFEDIKKVQGSVNAKVIQEGWLITNTKFTRNSIRYGECAGLTMISWGYPGKGNLRELIEETKVQPITALTSLSQDEKRVLLENKIVLCRTLCRGGEALFSLGIPKRKIEDAIAESSALCDM